MGIKVLIVIAVGRVHPVVAVVAVSVGAVTGSGQGRGNDRDSDKVKRSGDVTGTYTCRNIIHNKAKYQ